MRQLAELLDLDALLLAAQLLLLVFNVFELGVGVLDGVVQNRTMLLILRFGLVQLRGVLVLGQARAQIFRITYLEFPFVVGVAFLLLAAVDLEVVHGRLNVRLFNCALAVDAGATGRYIRRRRRNDRPILIRFLFLLIVHQQFLHVLFPI